MDRLAGEAGNGIGVSWAKATAGKSDAEKNASMK